MPPLWFQIFYSVIAVTLTIAARHEGQNYDRLSWIVCVVLGLLWPIVIPFAITRG